MVATSVQLEQAMEKPTVIMPETAPRGKKFSWVHGLFFYAGAMTAALIVVVALGTVLIQQSKDSCDTSRSDRDDSNDEVEAYQNPKNLENKKLNVNDNGKKREEQTSFDPDTKLEVILTRTNTSSQPTITVVDFKNEVIGIYDPSDNECYLIGGMDHRVAHTQDGNDDTINIQDEDSEELAEYEKVDGEPMTNSNMMPGELKEVCRGKPIYWMQKANDEVSRKKRAIYCRRTTCYWWRCCLPSRSFCPTSNSICYTCYIRYTLGAC